MIRLEVIGHLGRNAEVKTVGTNQVIEFSVAHTEKWKDQQTQQPMEKTIWVSCAKWVPQGGSIKVAEFLKQGTQVYVAGTCEARGYKARELDAAGAEQIKGELKLRVNDLQLLGGAQDQAAAAPAAQAAPPPPPPAPVWDGQKWVIPAPPAAAGGGNNLPF